MYLKTRYGSIVFKDESFYLYLNEGNTHFTCFTREYKLNQEFNVIQKKIIFNEPGHISHNLCIFKSKNKKDFYAIGGKNRNQEPWNDHLKKCCKIVVYLLRYSENCKWKIINNKKPIIYNNYPKMV